MWSVSATLFGLIALLVATPSAASLAKIDFTATGASVSGAGYIVLDSALLTGTRDIYGTGLIDDVMLTLVSIPSTPDTTTFTKTDFSIPWGVILSVLNSAIVDLNLNSYANIDGYWLNGVDYFTANLGQGTSNIPINTLIFSVTSITGVPEPTTLALFGLGLAGFGAVRRRKIIN